MKVAIQGEDGSFHSQAAREFYCNNITLVACSSFPGVFEAMKTGAADCAIAAIENTLDGSINQNYNLIEDSGVPIIGEVKLPVALNLISIDNFTPITAVYSHRVALAECRKTLTDTLPDAELIEHEDTAAAARLVRDTGDARLAAVSSLQAAELYHLTIRQSNVEDHKDNITRFLALHPDAEVSKDANRCSIVFSTKHHPGALVEVLHIIASYNINLTKLQSRPIIGKPWHYKFYAVLDTAGEPLYHLKNQLEPHLDWMKVLGEYKSAS